MVSLKPNFPLNSYSRELLIVLLPSCIPLIFFFSFLLVVLAFPVTCKAVHSSCLCLFAGFHTHFVICSFINTSLTFTLPRPFYFSCVPLYVVLSISPDRTPCVSLLLTPSSLPSDAFIRFLCIYPGYPTCFYIRYTVRSL